MKRERIRQVILALVGLFFVGLLYPLCSDLWHSNWLLQMNNNEREPMFLSFFVALGFKFPFTRGRVDGFQDGPVNGQCW